MNTIQNFEIAHYQINRAIMSFRQLTTTASVCHILPFDTATAAPSFLTFILNYLVWSMTYLKENQ